MHENDSDFKLPSERTIYRIMVVLNLSHRPKRKPHGITKADREARKSDKPLSKCVTDISEVKGSDEKLYISAIFDCFDVAVIVISMDTNMTAPISSGSSGGAVLNMQGQVIGISTAGIDMGQNLNLAVTYHDILSFLNGFI